jgi:hypothetical protein
MITVKTFESKHANAFARLDVMGTAVRKMAKPLQKAKFILLSNKTKCMKQVRWNLEWIPF